MLVTGKLIKVLDKQQGTSKSGKDWVKQTFVIDTNEQYNNIIAFELFGEEKVENFNKYNTVNSIVEVEFNVKCNEWQGKYFTSLQAWKVSKGVLGSAGDYVTPEQVADAVGADMSRATVVQDDLPF